MAGKKNHAITAVVDGLTNNQAATIQAEIIKIKNKIAPKTRGTIVTGTHDNVGNMINNSQREVGLIDEMEEDTNDKSKKS